MVKSREKLEKDLQTVQEFLQSLGWLVNKEKSSLTPAQRVTYLGHEISSVDQKVFLPEEKIAKVTHMMASFAKQTVGFAQRCLKGSRPYCILLSCRTMGEVSSTTT